MDLEYLASVGILGYQSGLWPSPCESQPSAAGAENEVDIAEQDELFSSGEVRIPSALNNVFFQIDFSLASVAPPSFAACVLALNRHGLPLSKELSLDIDDMDISAIAEVLSVFGQLQQLQRHCFLAATGLPPMFRHVPPAASLCRIFAMAQVRRCKVHFQHSSSEEFVCSYFDAMCEDLQVSARDFEGLYTLTEVLPSVYSVHTDSRLVLGSTFLRFQEYYECPNPEIRHHAFEFNQFKTWYVQKNRGGFDYYLQWPGFNIPSWVLDDARAGKLGSPLRPQEDAFLRAVPADAKYVIGSCEKDLQTLQHELAHGLYGTNENYREAVAQSLAKLPPRRWEASRRVLLDLGYVDDKVILEDEMQAYMIEGQCLYEEDEIECPTTGRDIIVL
ncbi:unnamed protein product [Cladocopium goreaui]|uniref:Uncharacterized protein n=1 Tax=Cladocopium goreaui TaxID=2562237 RepID=A0A9P1GE66_9DINO|nr:unnamed protein product [Cladocopium goreaui]